MKRAFLALIMMAALVPLACWALIGWQAGAAIHVQVEEIVPAKAGLVLGASKLSVGRARNLFFRNRIVAAAALFKAGKVEYLIVSGSQDAGGRPRGGYDEPADMHDALISQGVPANRIYRDYAGLRTLDSVARAHDVFGQDRVIIVSQPFHLARALFLARARGLDDEGFAAADPPLRFAVRTYLREIAARVAAVLDVLTNAGPRYAGSPVRLGRDAPT